MKLSRLEIEWDKVAYADPYEGILATKSQASWSPEAFFDTGRSEAADAVRRARDIGGAYTAAAAFDFGCGVGRVSYPLSNIFGKVVGVDISHRMLAMAKKSAGEGGARPPTFVHCADPGLPMIASAQFNFAFSVFTLQHIPPKYSLLYLQSLMRILRHDGVLVFQVPGERRVQRARGLLPTECVEGVRYLKGRVRRNGIIRMYGLSYDQVLGAITRQGGFIDMVDSLPDMDGWENRWFVVRKTH